MKIKSCQLESCQLELEAACKSSGFHRFCNFLVGDVTSSVSSSSQIPQNKTASISSSAYSHGWGFDDEELEKMWDRLHWYDGMHYAIRVIKDYDDEDHFYTRELRDHLEEWISKNSVFPIEHGVNCGSLCQKCGKMSCLKCRGDVVWVDDLEEWTFFCNSCFKIAEGEETNANINNISNIS
jgi:hypothetical protein